MSEPSTRCGTASDRTWRHGVSQAGFRDLFELRKKRRTAGSNKTFFFIDAEN
jgi:hypothetical protein